MIVMKFGGSSVQDCYGYSAGRLDCGFAAGGAAAGGGKRHGRRDR